MFSTYPKTPLFGVGGKTPILLYQNVLEVKATTSVKACSTTVCGLKVMGGRDSRLWVTLYNELH